MIIQLLKDKRHCLLAGTSTLSSSARRLLRPPEPSDSFLSQAVCSHDLMTSLMASSDALLVNTLLLTAPGKTKHHMF